MAGGERIQESIEALAARIGLPAFVDECLALLGGATREDHVDALRGLTQLSWEPGSPGFDRTAWRDFWVRSWGARGLLHVWHDPDGRATAAVVAGLGDEHYRPAEMCLKVATRHEVAGTGDAALRLATHDLPRVRAQAMRALAVVGDTEHAEGVRSALDDPDPAVWRHAARAWSALERRLDR